MAKHVTEDDLASGLAGFGDSLSTIAGFRPRRDNPFRVTGDEGEPPRAPGERMIEMRPQEPHAVAAATPPGGADARGRYEAPGPRAPIGSGGPGQEPPSPAPPLSPGGASRDPATPRDPLTREPGRASTGVLPHLRQETAPSAGMGPGTRKADIFTERVTLQLSTGMRDAVDALARDLQRRRTAKDERITANTVMRVAINILLERFELGADDVANSEGELLDLATRRICSDG